MTTTRLKSSCTTTQQNKACCPSLKGTTQRWLHTDKQEQARRTPWKDSSTTWEIRREALFQGRWRKYSNSYRCRAAIILLLWSESVTCKFITKLYLTYLKLSELLCKSEKIRKKECSLKDCQSGQSDLRMKYILWCKRVLSVEQQQQPKWTTFLQDLMLFL